MLLALIQILILLLYAAAGIMFFQAVLSWLVVFNVINTHSDFVRALLSALDRMTAPFYRPVRKVMPDFGGIDFSPIVVLLVILLLVRLLNGVAMQIHMSGG